MITGETAGQAAGKQAATPAAAPKTQQSSFAKKLSRGGSASFLINSAGMALAMLMQVALARVLGVDGYGVYAFVTTVVTFMVFPAKLGFDTAIVKLVAAYRVNGEWGLIKGLLQRSNQIGLALSIVLAVAGLAYVLLNGDAAGDTAKAVAYAAGFASIPLLTLATLRQSALQAVKDVLYAQMPEKILRPVLTIAFVFAASALGITADAGVAMLCFVAAVVIAYAVGAVVLKKRIGRELTAAVPQYEMRSWMKLSGSLMANAGVYLILGQLNVLMLGLIENETQSGIFSVAVRLATLVAFMLTAVNMTASPLISETYAKGDMDTLQKVCTSTGRVGFLFAVAVGLFFAIFGRWTLALFGPEFTQAYPAMLILVFGQVFNAFCGQNGIVATMTGGQNALTKVLVVAAVVNAALNGLLIPSLGMTGGAIAATASIMTWNIGAVMIVRRKPGVQTLAWSLGFHLKKAPQGNGGGDKDESGS
ncbi:oligosaccharide flippase family protein [Paenibacillus sp. NEAU-GSW1]|uniref:oligosaccharide flippase family protein n=1 Tax=Paenibacillus sp. NEAU-GSW1 TaxID=2682486 RepID=UPI0012E0FDB9|nr:oligosaccharide flippase family protein [Paenibacillus sp. NEAU-GSW1]MUT64774.1 oligosaccharide flippase family protein [Paenibacillus sp. NEAU-GSW1]